MLFNSKPSLLVTVLFVCAILVDHGSSSSFHKRDKAADIQTELKYNEDIYKHATDDELAKARKMFEACAENNNDKLLEVIADIYADIFKSEEGKNSVMDTTQELRKKRSSKQYFNKRDRNDDLAAINKYTAMYLERLDDDLVKQIVAADSKIHTDSVQEQRNYIDVLNLLGAKCFEAKRREMLLDKFRRGMMYP